jgi:LPXTG-motif cell wall-anchored protein
MNLEWVVTGIILLGAMLAGGISLYVKRRRESKEILDSTLESNESDQAEL